MPLNQADATFVWLWHIYKGQHDQGFRFKESGERPRRKGTAFITRDASPFLVSTVGRRRLLTQSRHATAIPNQASPGPVYNLKSSVGTQLLSQCTTAPAFRFGEKSLKLGDEVGRSVTPGPGQYQTISSIGKQPISQK